MVNHRSFPFGVSEYPKLERHTITSIHQQISTSSGMASGKLRKNGVCSSEKKLLAWDVNPRKLGYMTMVYGCILILLTETLNWILFEVSQLFPQFLLRSRCWQDAPIWQDSVRRPNWTPVYVYILVGGLGHFLFSHIGKNHPNWLIFFRGVAQPPTSR